MKPAAPAQKESEKERRRREAEARNALNALLKPLREKCAAFEEKIAALEREQAELEPLLADGALYDDFEKARSLTEKYEAGKAALDEAMSGWAEAQEALEKLTAELSG